MCGSILLRVADDAFNQMYAPPALFTLAVGCRVRSVIAVSAPRSLIADKALAGKGDGEDTTTALVKERARAVEAAPAAARAQDDGRVIFRGSKETIDHVK